MIALHVAVLVRRKITCLRRQVVVVLELVLN